MNKQLVPLIITFLLINACTSNHETKMILVKGGYFLNEHSNLHDKDVQVADFYIGKFEVSQAEWKSVMNSNPSQFKGDKLPVENVSWYDCIVFCNAKSVREGLEPYYIIHQRIDSLNQNDFDSLKWLVTTTGSTGYRLPVEIEWEYASSGGRQSLHHLYSGSDNINEVAWYWRNSGKEMLAGDWIWSNLQANNCQTHPVGSKSPNELGIYDLSGNVREWCEDWYVDNDIPPGVVRVQRGGGWLGSKMRCEIANRHHFDASGKGPDQGFRLCRSIANH